MKIIMRYLIKNKQLNEEFYLQEVKKVGEISR